MLFRLAIDVPLSAKVVWHTSPCKLCSLHFPAETHKDIGCNLEAIGFVFCCFSKHLTIACYFTRSFKSLWYWQWSRTPPLLWLAEEHIFVTSRRPGISTSTVLRAGVLWLAPACWNRRHWWPDCKQSACLSPRSSVGFSKRALYSLRLALCYDWMLAACLLMTNLEWVPPMFPSFIL